MHVLLLNGSPHEKGCTYTALSEVASVLESEGITTEIICAAKKDFTHDDVKAVAEKALASDGLVLGSPVWYAGPCGISKYFYDELFNLITGKMKLKFGASVVSCRRGGASATFDVLNKYFTIAQMPVVSSFYWNQVHGNTPDEVRRDEEGMQTMRVLGANLAYLIKAVNKAALPLPEDPARLRTNFIR